MTWIDDAACRDTDPDIWFSVDSYVTAEAGAICRGCPALEACLADAAKDGDVHYGIRAGMTPTDRRRWARTNGYGRYSEDRTERARRSRYDEQAAAADRRDADAIREADLVIATVAADHGLLAADLVGKSQIRRTVVARQAAMAAVRERTGLSYPKVAELFGQHPNNVFRSIKQHERTVRRAGAAVSS